MLDNNRFYFVAAALITLGLWILYDITTKDGLTPPPEESETASKGPLVGAVAGGIAILVVVAILYPGKVLALLIGCLFGAFSGAFVSGLLRAGFPIGSLWAGSLALLVLSIAYSLPIYQHEISALFQDLGLSSLKISVAEISLEAAIESKGSKGNVTGAGNTFPATSVARTTDPSPGLHSLDREFGDEPSNSDRALKQYEPSNLIDQDLKYIDFLEGDEYAAKLRGAMYETKAFLLPIAALSKCLIEYNDKIQDSQLLLIDIKPVMSSLFRLNEKAKSRIEEILNGPLQEATNSFVPQDWEDLLDGIEKTADTVRETLDKSGRSTLHRVEASKYTIIVDGVHVTFDRLVTEISNDIRDGRIDARHFRSVSHDTATVLSTVVNAVKDWRKPSGSGGRGEPRLKLDDVVSLIWAVIGQAGEPKGGFDTPISNSERLILETQVSSVAERLMSEHAEKLPSEPSNQSAVACGRAYAEMESLKAEPSLTTSYFQPYLSIALADLLLAHWAPDEAVHVLADWLTLWDKLASRKAEPGIGTPQDVTIAMLPPWFRVRVLSKLQLILEDLAGTNNSAFRKILKQYQDNLAAYLSSSRGLELSQIPKKCPEWSKSHSETAEMYRRLAYVLMDIEIDSLRTELNFLPIADSFAELENLLARSTAVTTWTDECLPTTPKGTFTLDFREGIIAEGKVTAGLVALATGERMSVIAASSGDWNRAEEARKLGERWLREGWSTLSDIWKRDTRRLQDEYGRDQDLSHQIFVSSRWDKTASLATRVMSRLRRGHE